MDKPFSNLKHKSKTIRLILFIPISLFVLTLISLFGNNGMYPLAFALLNLTIIFGAFIYWYFNFIQHPLTKEKKSIEKDFKIIEKAIRTTKTEIKRRISLRNRYSRELDKEIKSRENIYRQLLQKIRSDKAQITNNKKIEIDQSIKNEQNKHPYRHFY